MYVQSLKKNSDPDHLKVKVVILHCKSTLLDCKGLNGVVGLSGTNLSTLCTAVSS